MMEAPVAQLRTAVYQKKVSTRSMGLLQKSTEKWLKNCKDRPTKCFRQLLIDGAVIITSFAALSYLVDGTVVQWDRALKFYGLFLVVAFVFRYLDVDFQENLTRVAGFQIGNKLFSALTGV